jgi:hypothetical protein
MSFFRVSSLEGLEYEAKLGNGSQGLCLHTEQCKHRHSCLEWDLNAQSQCSSERREFMRGHRDRPVEPTYQW